jgi:hypothetical protein
MKRSILRTRSGTETKEPPPDGALSDQCEEAFDLIEPRSIGRCEVEAPTRTTGKPGSHLGVLVGGVIVDDEMDVEFCWNIGLYVPQEGEELLVAMAGFALGEDGTIEEVERRE